jgi:hypothetical protein
MRRRSEFDPLYILLLFKRLHFRAGVPSRWGLWERVALYSRHGVAKNFQLWRFWGRFFPRVGNAKHIEDLPTTAKGNMAFLFGWA